MRLPIRRCTTLLAAFALVGAAACGGDDDEATVEVVEIGTAPTEPGPPLGIDALPLDDSGATAFDQWPAACDLITDEVVDALFPQNEGIARDAVDRQVRIIDIGTETRDVTVPGGDCTLRIGLPQEGMGLDDDNGGVRVSLSVLGVGDPAIVQQLVGDPIGDPVVVGGTSCLADSAGPITCDADRFAFRASIDLRTHGQYVGSGTSPYSVDGEERVFGPEGDGGDHDAFVREVVLVPMMASVLDRLLEEGDR